FIPALGMIALSRMVLIDPGNRKRFTHLALSATPDPYEPPQAAPFFHVVVPLPEDLDANITVAVDAHPVPFRFIPSRPVELFRGKQLTVSLCRLDTDSWRQMSNNRATWRLPVAEDFVLPDIQAGLYSVSIEIAGAAAWTLERLQVAADLAAVEVKAVAAATVRFRLLWPQESKYHPDFQFFREGQPFTPFPVSLRQERPGDDTYIFGGFLPGAYKLRILLPSEPATKPLTKARKSFRSQPAVAGTEWPFNVPADPPMEMNLGDLRPQEAK
ncbi:MAG: hypothetical protein MUF04_09080, partial [Akkermansiaceae bacterium]|nr:hypothetical protein [Akkermansiaceae bacterium]